MLYWMSLGSMLVAFHSPVSQTKDVFHHIYSPFVLDSDSPGDFVATPTKEQVQPERRKKLSPHTQARIDKENKLRAVLDYFGFGGTVDALFAQKINMDNISECTEAILAKCGLTSREGRAQWTSMLNSKTFSVSNYTQVILSLIWQIYLRRDVTQSWLNYKLVHFLSTECLI